MNDFLANLAPYQIAGVLFVVAFIVHIILGFALKKLFYQTQKTKSKLDDYLLKSISIPLKVLVWFAWLYLSIDALKSQIGLLAEATNYIDIIPIFIITWALIRMVVAVESYLLESDSSGINNDSIRLIARLVRLLIIISIALGLAQYAGFSISGLLTFGGVGGVVMGFAAKDMLANIFGGLMIQMDKPFSTGDWIRSSEFEGTVEKIGWRMTRIRTFSKNPVYIPNSLFSSLPIETPSRMTNRRITEVIGIRYEDIAKMPKIVEAVEAMLKTHSAIDKNQALRVFFNYFNASSIDFNIYAFTKTTSKNEYQKVKQQILLEIADIIIKNNAEIAFPTQTLHIQSEQS